jgi:hypothetical protein
MEERIKMMLPLLDERQRRLFLASEALAYGHGGIAVVHRISGASKNTIKRGIREHRNGTGIGTKVRVSGGGRHRIEENRPEVAGKILEIVNLATYGNPQNVLSYTTESLRKIAGALSEAGIKVSYVTVGKILEDKGYSKQANQKMLQVGEPHPNRNKQFGYINSTAQEYIDQGEPVISVDTKKKENIGNFKRAGQEYRLKKDPRKVLDHDFPLEELGKIAPYGVYNVNKNIGFVNVGTSHDTSEFAVESISRWWETVGKQTYPDATRLYITCDCGGSNNYRVKMWKYQLQQFAGRTGIKIHVSHFPPGTSKWNKIEHRLFCYISRNWQGKPLVDVQTAVDLIGSTTTTTGLKVICVRDDTEYELAKKISDEEFKTVNLTSIAPFGAWNYYILPHKGQVNY